MGVLISLGALLILIHAYIMFDLQPKNSFDVIFPVLRFNPDPL